MDNLGSEVGHKMRSAVKAKLIELGSGSSTGYIDDELPDYVMIMVANKRSKVQMMDDLSLFLGKNTEGFVTWLHQVLDKLQQVTLPSTALPKGKRKNSETTDKKDKEKEKDKKKKKLKRDAKEKTPEHSTTPPPIVPVAVPSITDVFADHLIQRAKRTLKEADAVSVKKKEEPDSRTGDDFDIPTISEIAKNAATEANRRKEITELAELQRQIDEAKKQLRHMTSEDSDDDDFINLKADDGDELDNTENVDVAKPTKSKWADSGVNNVNELDRPRRVPITFKDNKGRERERSQNRSDAKERRSDDKRPEDKEHKERRPVLERLGTRSSNDQSNRSSNDNQSNRFGNEQSNRSSNDNQSSRFGNEQSNRSLNDQSNRSSNDQSNRSLNDQSSNSVSRRGDQKMYVPVYLRNKQSKDDDREKEKEKDRSREKTRENLPRDSRDLRERVRERRDRSDRLTDRDRQREKDYDRGRNVDSKKEKSAEIVSESPPTPRIGSRVIVAPPKPEYNEDVIEVPVNSVVKVQPRPIVPQRNQACKSLMLRAMAEAQKSIAGANAKPRESAPPPPPLQKPKPSIKDRLKLNTGIFTRSFRENRDKQNALPKGNIVVKVVNGKTSSLEGVAEERDEEEYCPTSAHGQPLDYEYIPQSLGETSEEDITSGNEKLTQFVVTLDAKDFQIRRKRGTLSPAIRLDEDEPVKRPRFEKVLNAKISSPLRTDVTHKVNKLIIQNDTEDEEEFRKEVANSIEVNRRKRRHVSPIKFDATPPKQEVLRKSRERTSDISDKSKDDQPDENSNLEQKSVDNQKVRTSITSVSKYDNLPPLSSTVTAVESKIKSKDRCKYYPTCSKGDRCEFFHPTTPCKAFPLCKFGDTCLYIHPKCKFDLTCSKLGCNFSHTPVFSAAPPLSSQVVPVSNYKKISANPLPALCRFYPHCSNTLCEFYHPKPCKFGKNCTNKVECNFYHFDMPTKNKLKWVASAI